MLVKKINVIDKVESNWNKIAVYKFLLGTTGV